MGKTEKAALVTTVGAGQSNERDPAAKFASMIQRPNPAAFLANIKSREDGELANSLAPDPTKNLLP